MANDLLARVEAFLNAHAMSPSRFGELAVRDKNFVRDLRSGRRRLLIETADRVDRFMNQYAAEARLAAPAEQTAA